MNDVTDLAPTNDACRSTAETARSAKNARGRLSLADDPAMMIAAAVLAIVVSTPVQEKDFAPPDRTLDVYERVLRFYRPPAGQSRWIARERIDPPGGPAFDMEEIAELLRRLGPGPFCASDIPRTCRSDRGGLLRLSPIKDLGGGRVSVVVAYESRAPYSPAIVTRQMFVLGQEGDLWQILRREALGAR